MKHKGNWERWRHRPGPWGPWPHNGERPQWAADWRRKRRRLFVRFLTFVGVLGILVAGGMAALAFLITRVFGGDEQTALLVWIGGCGLALALPLLAVSLAVSAYRRVATPLTSVMAAADAVAGGDLSVRVPETGAGEFGRLAQSFNRMTEELSHADQLRRNLTADVAHELRTPLHIIQGNLEGILDGVYEPTPDHLQATLDETRQLARLVDDLRTLSLAEAGQLPLRKEAVNLADLLADVATSFSGQVEARGVTLHLESACLPPNLTVFADAGRLDQVLGNLIVNAIRHTPAGGQITLSGQAAPGAITILVRDSGEGISPDDLPHIFDRFWRGDRARTHRGGVGGGLGLAIARQLVQAHGGQIGVESALGHGAAFTITLPGTEI